MKFLVVVATWLALGCTNPMDVKIPIDSEGQFTETEDFKKVTDKLAQADKEMLGGYVIRMGIMSLMTKTPMISVTVGEAIKAQKKFATEQKIKAELQAAEQAKQEAEAQALRDAEEARVKRIKDMMSAYLISKEYVKANYRSGQYQDRINMSFAFKNNTEKKIVGSKGSMEFYNSLGDRILGLNMSIEYDIEPNGGAMSWTGGMDYNQFMDDNVQLANAPMDKLKTEWIPSMIMFADGTVERLE